MELTAGATATSAAISFLPDDQCTPIAQEIAELACRVLSRALPSIRRFFTDAANDVRSNLEIDNGRDDRRARSVNCSIVPHHLGPLYLNEAGGRVAHPIDLVGKPQGDSMSAAVIAQPLIMLPGTLKPVLKRHQERTGLEPQTRDDDNQPKQDFGSQRTTHSGIRPDWQPGLNAGTMSTRWWRRVRRHVQ